MPIPGELPLAISRNLIATFSLQTVLSIRYDKASLSRIAVFSFVFNSGFHPETRRITRYVHTTLMNRMDKKPTGKHI
jgi:hypothetical protein